MTPHKSHVLDFYKLSEEAYDRIFHPQFIAEQVRMLHNIELNSLRQRAKHTSTTESDLITINSRISEIEQLQLMHILKYNNQG